MRTAETAEPPDFSGPGVEEILRTQLEEARVTITRLERILAENVSPSTAAYWRALWERDRRNLHKAEDRIAWLEGRPTHRRVT